MDNVAKRVKQQEKALEREKVKQEKLREKEKVKQEKLQEKERIKQQKLQEKERVKQEKQREREKTKLEKQNAKANKEKKPPQKLPNEQPSKKQKTTTNHRTSEDAEGGLEEDMDSKMSSADIQNLYQGRCSVVSQVTDAHGSMRRSTLRRHKLTLTPIIG